MSTAAFPGAPNPRAGLGSEALVSEKSSNPASCLHGNPNRPCAVSTGWAQAALSAQRRYPKLSSLKTRGGHGRPAGWSERTTFGELAYLSLPFKCLGSCPLAGCVNSRRRERSHGSLQQSVLRLGTGPCAGGRWPTVAFLLSRQVAHIHTAYGKSFPALANR